MKSNYDAAYNYSISAHAPKDAEKNVIVGIQKNGTDLNVNSSTRKVNITVPTSASDIGAVPTSRTINGKALSANITLSASDIRALPDTTVIPSIDGLATETYVDTKQAKITASGILKGNGAGGVSAAVKGTDYAAPSVGVTAALSASGWTQTVSVSDVTASSNGALRIAQSATDEQFTAWGAAQLRVTAQAAGTLTVKATGTVPTIDIPVEVLIV